MTEEQVSTCPMCNGAGEDGHSHKCPVCQGQGGVIPATKEILAALTRADASPDEGLAKELSDVMRGVVPRPPADEAISLDWRLCDRILATLRARQQGADQ